MRVIAFVCVSILALVATLVVVASSASAETVVPAGTYTASQTWTLAGSPYNLTGGVAFRNQATLTIEPGVVVRGASSSAYLQIGTSAGYCCNGDAATLNALGTQASPIVFEAANASQGWGGLRFRTYWANQPTGTLQNVTLGGAASYAADLQSVNGVLFDNVTFLGPANGAGLYLGASSPTIKSSSFVGGQRGILSTWDSRPTITDSDFSGQTVRYARVGLGSALADLTFDGLADSVEVVTGGTTYTSSLRVSAISAPYELLEASAFRNGATLTIDAGVQMKGVPGAYFQIGTSAGYCCNGDAAHLDVAGTQLAPVVLDATGPGGWGGIRFRTYYANQPDGVLRNVTLANATTYAADLQSVSGVTFDNVTFRTPGSAGLYVSTSSPVVKSSSFLGGPRGILAATWDSRPDIRATSFADQTARHARVGFGTSLVDVAFSGTGSAVEIIGGNQTFTAATRVRAIDVPYELLDWLAIRNQQTLTLDPGVHIRAYPWAYIQVGTNAGYCCSGDNAMLDANGTALEPIVLEPTNATAGWGGLRFRTYWGNTATGWLSHATVRGATSYGIDVASNSGLTFDNVTFDANGVAGLYLASSSPTVRTASFVGGQRGILVTGWDSRPIVLDTSFVNQSVRHARIGFGSGVANLSFAGTGSAVELMSGDQTWTSSVALSPVGVPYELLESVTFRNNATLTLDPGLRLKVAPTRYLQIGTASGYGGLGDHAHLVAEGTAAEPIVIESTTGINTTGWGGIRFRSYWYNTADGIVRNATIADVNGNAVDLSNVPNVLLDNVTIERPTAHGVSVTSSSTVTLRGGTINSTGGYGVFATDTSSGASIAGTTFSGNSGRPWRLRVTDSILDPVMTGHLNHEVEYYGSDVTSNRVLRTYFDAVTSEPYASVFLTGFTVYNAATWTIEPGARILLENNIAIAIGSCCSNPGSRGNLSAEGTEALPISFSSRSGATATGWQGFYFRGDYSGGTSVLRNVTVSLSRNDGIESYQYGAMTLDNVTIDRNARYGMLLTGGGPYALTNTHVLRSASHGLYLQSGASPTMRGGSIENSAGYGIWSNDAGSGATVLETLIANSTQRALRLRVTDTTTPILSNNTIRELEYWGVDVTSSRTLPTLYDQLDGARYTAAILSSFTVYNQATWTIEPDARILVGDQVSISIGSCCNNPVSRGNLTALGTQTAPIYFGSRSGSATGGWYGLYFRGDYAAGTSVLRNVTSAFSRDDGIEAYHYGSLTLDNFTAMRNARHGLLMYGISPTVTTPRIAYSGSHGIWQGSGGTATIRGGILENNNGNGYFSNDASAGATILGTAFQNNTVRPFKVRITDTVADIVLRNNTIQQADYHGVDITSDRTLAPFYDVDTGARYASVISSGFTVYNQATWTIMPDTRVLVENAQAINIGSCCNNPGSRGNLTALGTQTQPITLSAYTGSAATGWYGLYFRGDYAAGTSVLRNATVALSRDEGIETYSYNGLTLDNVTLDRNARYGIQLHSSSIPMRNVVSNASGSYGAYFSSSAPVWRGGGVTTSGASGIYTAGCGVATLEAIVIDRATGYGLYAEGPCNGAHLDGVTFTNVTGRPWRDRLDVRYDVTIFTPGIQEVEYWGVDLTSNRTLPIYTDSATGGEIVTSVILSGFEIRNNAVWTIPDGSNVLWENTAYVNVGTCAQKGSLKAEGTQTRPITMRSRTGSASTGWYGLYFRGDCSAAAGESVLRNATVALSRDEGIETYSYNGLTLDNVTLERNARYGIQLQSSSIPMRNVVSNASGSYGAYFSSSAPVWRGGGVTTSGASGIYTAGCGIATLDDIVVTRPTGYGLYADGTCNGAHLDGVAFSDVTRAFRNRLDLRDELTITNATVHEAEYWGADVLVNRTVPILVDTADAGELTTVILSGFEIRNNAVLEFPEGSNLLWENTAYVNVGTCGQKGSLVAEGTQARPIQLRSRTGSASTGWYGMYFRGDCGAPTGQSVLRNATVALSRDEGIETYSYNGLALDNVTLTNNARDGLQLSSSSPSLRNVVSNASGRYGMYAASSAPTWRGGGVTTSGSTGMYFAGCGVANLVDVSIEAAAGYGLYADGSCNGANMERVHFGNVTGRPFRNRLDASMIDVTATNPGIAEVELWGQTISGARTLTLEPVLNAITGSSLPTVILGTFTVNGGAILDLAPGLELRLRANEYVNLGSNSGSRGTLTARGTRERPINISGVSTAIGGWGSTSVGGVYLEWTNPSVIRNTTIDGANGAAVYVVNGNVVSIDNATLKRGASSGLVMGAGSPRAFVNDTNLTMNNVDGIYVENGAVLELRRSNLSRNLANGLEMKAGTATVRESTFFENARSGINATGGNPSMDVRTSYLWKNGHYGANLAATTGSTIVDNAFIENVMGQARATAWNRWNVSPVEGRNIAYGPFLGGNSWSDYAGEDTDANGLGDTLVPYNAGIAPGYDLHPVMGNLYADFAVTIPDVVNAPHELLFRDASRGGFSPVDQWVWDLGDGSQFVTENVTHTFAADGSYPVQLTVANAHGQVSQLTRVVHVDSIEPSTSALVNGTLGANGWYVSPVNVTLNATDDRSGVNQTFYALDGGNLTVYGARVFVPSNGLHNLTYHSVDRNGNAEVPQTVAFRLDRTLPVVVNASLNGTPGNAGWYVSDVVATLTATDNVSGVDHIEHAFNATPNLTYVDGVTLSTDGIALLRYRAIDQAGLVSLEKNVTIRRDATLPLVNATLDGTLGGGVFWLGPVTVNASAMDATSGLASLTYSVDGAPPQPVNGTIVVSGHGIHTVNVTATDVAGNVNDTMRLIVQIDLQAPASEHHFDGILGANGVYVSMVNVTFTGNDSFSGVDRYVYSIDGGDATVYDGNLTLLNEGQHQLVYHAVDVAGNAETIHEVIIVLDLAAPTTNLNLTGTPGSNGWFLSNVTGELTVDDPSSLDHSAFSLDGSATQTYVSPFLIGGEGIHNVTFHSVSVGGLVEANQTRAVRIDLTPPSVAAALNGTLGLAGWYVTPVQVALLPTDAASGIATTRIGVDGAPLTTYTGPVAVATTGLHAVAAQTDDVAGRTFAMANASFQVDVTDPVSTAQLTPAAPDGANGWYVTSPVLTLGATDAGAGVDRILVSIDGAPEEIVTGPLVLPEGNHTVEYRAVDVAGRIEALRALNVRVDLTPPTLDEVLSGVAGNAGWYVSAVNATLAPTDATSGIAAVYASVDGAPEQPVTGTLTVASTRTHTIAWRAVDVAGRSANETLTVKVDRSAPTTLPSVTPGANARGWRNTVATVTMSATDQPGLGSGVFAIETGLDGGALGTYTAPFTVGEGFHNLSHRGIDVAGLVNLTQLQAVNVDLTPPSLTHAMRAPDANGWYTSSVPVSFTPADALSGFYQLEWWIDNGPHTNTTALTVLLDAANEEGQHVLHAKVRDRADLVSATLDIPYGLDVSAPTLTHALAGTYGGANRSVAWYRTPVNFTLNPADGGSGVASTTYVLDGAAPQAYAGALAFPAEGSHNLSASVLDHVGRGANLTVPAFGVDLTPPNTTPTLDGTLDPEDGIYKTPVTVSFAATDALSGVGANLLKVNTGSGWATYTGALVYNTTGNFTILYQATDVAGNVEAVKTLAFGVFVDTTPPVTALTPAPTGWYGAPVAPRLNATDVQSSVQLVLYRIDGGDLIEVPGSVADLPALTEGVHTIEYAAIDIAGNLELIKNATYRIDLTPPTLALNESYTPGNNGWIKSAVQLAPVAGDALSGISHVTARVNGVNQSVDGVLTLAASGYYNVTMTAFDLAGLPSNVVAWTGRLDVGLPAPSVVVVGPLGVDGWHRDNVSVLLTATDAVSGVDLLEYSWDNASWETYPGAAFQFTQEGLHWLQVRVTDKAGNLAQTTGQNVGIDRTLPTIETDVAGTEGLAGWYVSPVTATTTVSDLPGTPGALVSGVHSFSRSVDGGPNASAALPSVVELATSGVHTLSAFALDKALNAQTAALVIPVDLDDPSLNHTLEGERGLEGWYVGPVTLNATSIDPTSGPAAPLLDGAPLAGPVTFSDDGARTLLLQALDAAGRAGETATLPVNIDTTPPEPVSNVTGEGYGVDGWLHGNATITLGMLDLTSGAGAIQFKVDHGSLETYTGPFQITADGIHVIDFVAFDVAGNLANATLVVKLDNELPVALANVTGVVGNNSWYRSSVNITLDASDPVSGVASIEYSLDGGAWLPYLGEPITIATEGRHTLAYRAIDGSGLPSITYYHEILIDVTTPVVDLHLENTLFIEFDGKLYVSGTLCIEVTGLDLLSGLSDLAIHITGIVTDIIHIELDVGMHCIDLEGAGGGGGGGGCGICAIASDLAGNEEIECMDAIFDPVAPSAAIIRPFPGALNLQNTSIPLFSAAFGNGASLGDPGFKFNTTTPEGDPVVVGGPTHVVVQNSTLAQTTLVAGTRVPVWVVATDGLSPIRRVELKVDDQLIGVSNKTENVTFQYVVTQPRSEDENPEPPTLRLPPEPASNETPDQNEHHVRVINVTMPVYVFHVDTLKLVAGDHVFSARAWDVPGNLAQAAKIVGYVSPAIGNATVSALENATADRGTVKEQAPNEVRDAFPREFPTDTWEAMPDQEIPDVPEDARDRMDTFIAAARIAAQLYDFLMIDNYAFVDRTVVEEMDAYETADDAIASLPVAPPPLVYAGVYTWLHPLSLQQVTDEIPEELPVNPEEILPGGDEE